MLKMIVYIISQKPGKYKTNFIKPSQRKTDILYREFAAKSHFILEMLAEQEPNALRLLDRLEELRMLIAAKADVNSDVPFVLSTIHSCKGLEYDRVVLLDRTVQECGTPAQVFATPAFQAAFRTKGEQA